jgi:hypothetical protein
MPSRIRAIAIFALVPVFMALTACSKPAKGPADVSEMRPPASIEHGKTGPGGHATPAHPTAPAPQQTPRTDETPVQKTAEPCLECETATEDSNRDDCFKLQPGKNAKNAKGKTVTGRCRPQCIPYARCRSGFMSCRLGDTSPVQWFECARKARSTSAVPKAGSIMVIGVEQRHNMATGHLGYVEEACPNPDGTWALRFSHTNYDRKCHLDLDARVLFNPKTMRAAFQSGPWKPWARDLKILGFILK